MAEANTVEQFDERFFAVTGEWLGNAELRRLIAAAPPHMQTRREWFETLPERTDYRIWGVCHHHEPIGCFGLKHIHPIRRDAEYWGYIGIPQYWGRNIGQWILEQAVLRARQSGLTVIYLRLLNDNQRAVRLYRKFGFIDTAIDGQLLIMHYPLEDTATGQG